MENHTITGVRGFEAAGLSCGIKRSGKKDIGLIVCNDGATAAGMFTTNKVYSAAVKICKKHLNSSERVLAVVVNSGNANACTGQQGINDAISMCGEAANPAGAYPHEVLVASTGIIGEKLPMDKIIMGIRAAWNQKSSSPQAGQEFAESIMTTDTKCKQAFRTVEIAGNEIRLAGTVKGAGMIGPNMATTLCFLVTDAKISKELLQKALKSGIGESLNKLTVDMHQSTNDTALMLASGKAGDEITAGQGYAKFEQAVIDICEDLAKQMALDAEGATRRFKVLISEAASAEDARKAARAIADYPLVKCAVHGSDPNWGRIICGVGSCGVELDPEKLWCKIGDITVFKNGEPTDFDRKRASEIIAGTEHIISVGLGAGNSEDFCWGCDLSKDYVTINADYHT